MYRGGVPLATTTSDIGLPDFFASLMAATIAPGIHTVGCAGFVQSLDDFIGRRTGTYACGNCLKAVIGYGYLWHGATPGYTGRALASTGGKDCSLIMSNRLVFSKIQGC